MWLRDSSLSIQDIRGVVEYLTENEIFVDLRIRVRTSTISQNKWDEAQIEFMNIYKPSADHLSTCPRNCSNFLNILM